MCFLCGLQRNFFCLTTLIHRVKFLMAEQIFAAMSLSLSWHRLFKVSLQVFHITFNNQHPGGHQFSASSKPTLKGRNTLLNSHSLENKHSVLLWLCPQSDSRKSASLSLLVMTLSPISQPEEVTPCLKFTCLTKLSHLFSAVTKILSF